MIRAALFAVISVAILTAGAISAATPRQLEARADSLLERTIRGDYAAATANGLDSTMKEALPPEKLEEIWSTLQQQVGEFVGRDAARSHEEAGYRMVFIPCEFKRMTLDAKIVFDRDDKVAGLFFVPAQTAEQWQAPEYADTTLFRETPVRFGLADWKLTGTISQPTGDGVNPAVVLVHGSGPNDRDETIGPNKPFRDLAWGLASHGVVVLRYDKRTLVYGPSFAPSDEFTVDDETVDDAVAAVAFLRSRPGVDSARVFVIGHSLGAMMAPRIAHRAEGVAGIVLLAAPARPLEDLILEQTNYLQADIDSADTAARAELAELRRQVNRVKDPELSSNTPADSLPLGIPVSYWLDLRNYRPVEACASLDMPVLVLHGERDYQVTMTDLAHWRAAADTLSHVSVRSFARLNHLFIAGEGRSLPAEYFVSGHVDQEVIGAIVSWIVF